MKVTWKLCFCIASLVVISTQASGESSGSLRYMEPYSVEGLGVGMPVVPNSREYRRYNCKPSEQYINSITCKFSETKGGINKIITILHLYNNIVTYINKSVYPAYFTNEDIDGELKRLSIKFNELPHVYSSREGLIATWGGIKLNPLGQNDLSILASGGHPSMGFMVDYLMNFNASAAAGLPVYSLGGGKGFVWIARFEKNREKGGLRFLAADPSQMNRGAVETAEFPPADTGPPNQSPPLPHTTDAREGIVPMEKVGGVYVVPVSFNGAITLDAIVDSGASDVSVPADVVMTLMRTKTISDQDFLGAQTYILADGSKVPSARFRIRSLKVGGNTIENVEASIASSEAVILLGQSFLGRFRSWSVDNDKHTLILK